MKIVLVIIVVLVFIYFFRFIFWFILAKINSKKTIPFKNEKGLFTIQVHGDSTALGTGASAPEKSLAGLVGLQFHKASVKNYGALGRTIFETAKLIECAPRSDLLIVCCAGPEILYFHRLKNIKRDICTLFTVISKNSPRAIIITPINIGFSPVFPVFLRAFYKRKSLKVGIIFNEIASKYPLIFLVNNLLIASTTQIPPWKEISSSDALHPNDAGYAWIYSKIRQKLPEDLFNEVKEV